MPSAIGVRFYRDEPSFKTFEEPIEYTDRNPLQPEARALTARLRGRRISGARHDDDHLFISLDDATVPHFYLTVERVGFELLASGDPWSEAVGRRDLAEFRLFRHEGSERPFEWNRETIPRHLQNRRLFSLTAQASSVLLDVGNALALSMSRMFVVGLARDVLYFEFDVEPDGR